MSRSATPEVGLLADRQLEGATPAPNRSRSWSSVASKLARSRSSLLTNIMRGTPSSRPSPDHLGLDLDAVDGADHEHGQVGHAQGGHTSPMKSA